nr:hypothetical protein CFP56_50474 [Quercus suber]
MDEQQVERPRSRERVGASESSDDTTSLPPPSSLSPVDINTSPPQSPNKKNSHAAINDGNLEKPQMMSTIPVISQSNSDVDNMPAPAVTLSEEVVAIEDKPPPHLSSSSTISATESMHPPPPRSSTLTLVNNKSMAPPASSPSTRVSSLKPASPSMQLREPTSSPESLQSASENGLQVEDLHGMDRTDDILLEDPNQPIVDFSWEDMQQRYHDTVKELEKDEQRIFEQFDRLCNVRLAHTAQISSC